MAGQVTPLEKRRQILAGLFPKWEEKTIYQHLCQTAQNYPDSIFFVDEREYTYSEILNGANRLACRLQKIGIGSGDCVIVALGNRVEFLYVTFALSAVGAVKVALNRNVRTQELEYIWSKTNARVIIVENDEAVAGSEASRCLEKIISLDPSVLLSNRILSWADFWGAEQEVHAPEVLTGAGPVSDILFTSGSTGSPKGVTLTDDMILRSAYANCLNRGFEPGRRIYVPVPLYHVYGYVEGIVSALLVHGTIIVTKDKFDVDKALLAMERWRANDILCVPYIIMKFLQHPDLGRFDLSRWTAVYCSASTCPAWVWKGIREKLGISEITTGYGMTEVSGATIQTPPDCDTDILMSGIVGRVLFGGSAGTPECGGNIAAYKIVDLQTGKEVPPGECGELVCRGPVVTQGYYKDAAINYAVFDDDGWFYTGDTGFFDEHGWLKLTGRKDDGYKVNGENVSPHFVDKVISNCDGVIDVETVGIPDERLGWVGAAFIHCADASSTGMQVVISYCKGHLAPYQIPKYYIFDHSDHWPRTATGKVVKHQLKRIAIEKISGKAAGVVKL